MKYVVARTHIASVVKENTKYTKLDRFGPLMISRTPESSDSPIVKAPNPARAVNMIPFQISTLLIFETFTVGNFDLALELMSLKRPSEVKDTINATPPSTSAACSTGIIWPGVTSPQYASVTSSAMKIAPRVTNIGLWDILFLGPLSMNGSKMSMMNIKVTSESATGRPAPSNTEILRI